MVVELPSGIVTFLFSDIEESSSKWDRAHDAMSQALAKHDEIFDASIRGNSGVVVKKIGDGYMAVFSAPAGAVKAALGAQRAIGQVDWPTAVAPFRVRVGIHTGPGEPHEDDYLGPSVNRAARIEAAGHGGQTLVSAATRELVGDGLTDVGFHDLGEHQLRGLSRPERVFQVSAGRTAVEFPPLRTETTPTNLPADLDELVGRRGELEALVHAVEAGRLVTVTGAGGVGKTTLALEAARRMGDRFRGGVWLLELAPLREGRLIAAELLGAMRRPAPADRDPEDLLVEVLESQQALLVLDNCEHLIGDVAELAQLILRRAAQVTILATSREPLGVHAENIWAIPTMGLPEDDSVEAVLASDAGAFFAARAAQADRQFAIDVATAPIVAAICRRLDGLPLAIELAAARLRSMGIGELNDRLEDRFKLLRTRDRDVMPHHQTLRDTVAWSYELLGEAGQRLYRRLSIFTGGFDLEAAEAIGDGGAYDFGVIDGLDLLVGQSLIEVERGASTRYRLLETIKEFGIERLREAGEYPAAAVEHLSWISALSREGARGIEGKDQVEWLQRFRREIDNIRAGLAWALANDPITGAKIASSLSRFFWMYAAEGDVALMTDSTSFLREGYDWSVAMLEAGGEELPGPLRGRLQLAIGGLLCVRLGRYEEALERLEEATEIFERLEDERNLGWAVFYRSIAGFGFVDLDETIDLVDRALSLHSSAGDQVGAGTSMLVTGLFRSVREPGSGRPLIEKFAAGAEATGSPFAIAHGADALAFDDALTDRVSNESRENAARALALFRRTNNYACLCHALGTASGLLARTRDYEGAARVLGLASSVRDRLSMASAPYERRDSHVLDMAGTQAHGESWHRAVAEGATIAPDEGIDWTMRRLGHQPAEFE